MPQKVNIRAYIAWINTCIIWGTTYLAIRIGVVSFPIMLFAGLRWIAAGLILAIILKIKNYKFPGKEHYLKLIIISILLLGLGNGLVVFSEQYIPSGFTALLITTTPFWMVGIESLIPGKKHFNFLIAAGLFLGFAGVALIFGSDLKSLFNKEYISGVIGIILAVVAWAGGSVYSKHNRIDIHPLTASSFQMIVAGILQTILGIFLGEFSEMHVSTDGLLAFLYLIFFGSLIGYTSYIYAINHLPISLVSTYAYINPIIALFLGWLILDEKMTLLIVISSVIILIGVAFVKFGSEKISRDKKILIDLKEKLE